MRTAKVLCGECGAEMKIEEWGPYMAWFSACYRDENSSEQGYPSPHRNRGHPCTCGKYWLSSDNLMLIEDNAIGIVYRFSK